MLSYNHSLHIALPRLLLLRRTFPVLDNGMHEQMHCTTECMNIMKCMNNRMYLCMFVLSEYLSTQVPNIETRD